MADDDDELAEDVEEVDVDDDFEPTDDEDFEGGEEEFGEDEDFEGEEEEEEEEDEDEDLLVAPKRVAKGEEDEDEDEDLVTPDDVEADLDTILKDRLVSVSDDDDEDEDEDEEPEDRAEGADRLQPKRADETLCPQCFLLVRASAPGCPVGDDECPLFPS
jgi:hypothetical protein